MPMYCPTARQAFSSASSEGSTTESAVVLAAAASRDETDSMSALSWAIDR